MFPCAVPCFARVCPPWAHNHAQAGTGYNNVALEAARARGIVVTNCPAYSSDAVAHLVHLDVGLIDLHACTLDWASSLESFWSGPVHTRCA